MAFYPSVIVGLYLMSSWLSSMGLISSAPTGQGDPPGVNRPVIKFDDRQLKRLRNMYSDSVKTGIESVYETMILKSLADDDQLNKSDARIMQDSFDKHGETQQVIHLDPSQIPTKSEAQKMKSHLHEVADHHLSSGFRQSSLFPGFTLPVMQPLGANPLVGGFKMPPLPTLPPFPGLQAREKPKPQPKSSIIGNNGGPMSLTNDNVVVVNVLSNNW